MKSEILFVLVPEPIGDTHAPQNRTGYVVGWQDSERIETFGQWFEGYNPYRRGCLDAEVSVAQVKAILNWASRTPSTEEREVLEIFGQGHSQRFEIEGMSPLSEGSSTRRKGMGRWDLLEYGVKEKGSPNDINVAEWGASLATYYDEECDTLALTYKIPRGLEATLRLACDSDRSFFVVSSRYSLLPSSTPLAEDPWIVTLPVEAEVHALMRDEQACGLVTDEIVRAARELLDERGVRQGH